MVRKNWLLIVAALILGSISSYFIGNKLNLRSRPATNTRNIDDLLESELGANFKKSNMKEIYLAGPNRTYGCPG